MNTWKAWEGFVATVSYMVAILCGLNLLGLWSAAHMGLTNTVGQVIFATPSFLVVLCVSMLSSVWFLIKAANNYGELRYKQLHGITPDVEALIAQYREGR